MLPGIATLESAIASVLGGTRRFIGAEIASAGVLAGGYLDLRAFGTLGGLIFGWISFAPAAWPYHMTSVLDLAGSRDGALLAVATLLVLPRGAYADPPQQAAQDAARGLRLRHSR